MAIKPEELAPYVMSAAEGDKASFEELYKQTCSTVYFTCLSFLKNEQDAADMTQEVYIAVLNSLSTLEDQTKFLPWLSKITVNKCKNRLKAAWAVPVEMEEENQPVEENENFLPEEYITNQAKRKIVMDIMKERLTEAQYRTVIMFYFNELTAQEISEIMECPIGTVTYRLSAAREKIRRGVSEYENTNHDKLYSYAAAVPFLAGLLTAEALSLNVQAAAADAASIINAASSRNVADISKGGLKKMLKTPKTIIAAAAAAVVIIGGIAAAVIATNHEDAPSSGTQTRQEYASGGSSSNTETDPENQQASSSTEADPESQQASSSTETDSENPQTSSDMDENAFWLSTADWGEEKDLTGITIFNGECTAPIHLEDFDGDDHLGPYFVGHYQPIEDSYERFWDAASSYNLTELLTDQRILYGKEDYITPQHSCDEEGHSVWMHSYEDDAAIWQINLCNYSEENTITYQQIYDNNWFFIQANGNAILEWTTAEELDYNDYHDLHAILDKMIDKYGRPSYLISCDDTFLENYEKNLEDIQYILVWEKEDFVITMEVMEAFFSDTGHYANALEQIRNSGKNYGMYLNTLGDLIYITREAWEDGYKEYYYPQEGYGADYNTHTYYDLDDLK